MPASQQISQQPRGGRLRPAPTQSELNDPNIYERSNNRRRGQANPQANQQANQQANNRRRQNLANQNAYSTRGYNGFNYDKLQYSTANNNGYRQLEPSILSPDEFVNKNQFPTTTLSKLPVTITSLVPIIKTLPIKHGFRTSYATLTTTTFNTSVIRPDQYQTRLDSNNLANTVSIFTEYIDPLQPTKVTQVLITTTAIQEVKQILNKIGFQTRTETLTSVQILTTLTTNYLSTSGFATLLPTATAPPGYTLVSTSYPTTITQLSSFVVSLVLHGKTLLSTLSTSLLLPTTVHTYKTVKISPSTSELLTTQLTITLTGDNGDLTQLVTAVTLPPNLIQPSSTQPVPIISITAADPNNHNNLFSAAANSQPPTSQPPNNVFGEYIAGAETSSSPTFVRPQNAARQRKSPPAQSLNNRNNLSLLNISKSSSQARSNSSISLRPSSTNSFKYNYTAHSPLASTQTLPELDRTESALLATTSSGTSSSTTNTPATPPPPSTTSRFPPLSISTTSVSRFNLLPSADLSQANYSSAARTELSSASTPFSPNNKLNAPPTSVLKHAINTFTKGDQTGPNQIQTTNRTQQASRPRQASLSDQFAHKNASSSRKRPNKKLQKEKYAAASLATAYKQSSLSKKSTGKTAQPPPTTQPPSFQKRKLFQYTEERADEPAAIPLQPNRVRQRLANAQSAGTGFQRVNVRTAAASNPPARRLSLTPNTFLENFGGAPNSSPNENPTTRFQRIVNSALTHSTPANSLLANDLLTPNTFGQNLRQPASLSNPLVLDLNSFTPNDGLFGNQPLLNEDHLINIDTPRRQFNRIKPNSALFNPLNSLDFLNPLNPIASVSHNPGAAPNQNRRNPSSRKPAQASRVRIPSSQLFLGGSEPTINPFLPTRSISPAIQPSIDFNNFNSYNVEPLISRISAADVSANVPDYSIRIQPSSVIADPAAPTASKRLVRVRRPNNGSPNTATTPSLPPTTPNNRRRVNVNRNKNEGTQGRGPLNGLYGPDDELNYGHNNAIDGDDSLLANLNNNLANNLAINKLVEPSRAANKDESVLVNYQTVFTYLTTVIKGQHTLFTSRLSTTSESSTKSVDDELSVQLEKGVVIQPTETINLGTKTKGATTTIVNMQSQVNVENFKPLPPALHVTPTVSPLDQNNLQPTRIKFLEKPEIVVDEPANLKQTPKLSLDQIKQAARVLQTEYFYIYTVYDSSHTRKSTRNEVITNTLSQPLDLATIEVDSTVDPSGYLRIGPANGEQINLGKRVKSGSTTEVNLQLRTVAKLDGLANRRVEVTASIQPVRSSSVEQPSSSKPVEPSRARSSLRVVSSRVSSAVQDSAVQPSKSRLAVRIRKPIYSRVPGISNNRIVSSRVANSRLHHLSTSESPQIEPTKVQEPTLATNDVSSLLPSSAPNEHTTTGTPLLESSLSSIDLHHSSTPSALSPTTPISSAPVDSSSKRRVVTVRKPLTGFHRMRTKRPPFLSSLSSPDLIAETESAVPGSSSSVRFSLYPRFTISHSSASSSSSAPASASSSLPVPTGSSKPFLRVRLTSSRVIKSKSSSMADKSTAPAGEIPKVFSSAIQASSSIIQLLGSSGQIQPTAASDMETRTMFTTFTYFTTFYQSGGQSKVVSSESTMSNVITVPASDLASASINLLASSSAPEQSFTLQSASSVLATPSMMPILITEHSERTETSTILNTITYFATLYNGTKSTITPIEEVKTELLTLREPVKITRTIHPLVGGSLQPTQSLQSLQPSEQPRNVFVRTYYTTYTNPVTLFNVNGPSVSNVEEVVSNVSSAK